MLRADDDYQVTSTAAQPVTGSIDPADELFREARKRRTRGDESRALLLAGFGGLVACLIAAEAIWLHGGPAFLWWRFVFFVALYAIVGEVEFEVGTGGAIPTELVFVPMLFALPTGLVPAAAAAGLVARFVRHQPSRLLRPTRMLVGIGSAAFALGPALVLSLAGGLPLRWSAWPIYVVALAAQLAGDFASAAAMDATHGHSPGSVFRYTRVAYAVDAALAPTALLLAFATEDHTALLVLVLPLVALLSVFARERKNRITHALELSDAYRGTAFLLGDVVEADDEYTGSHSRHVVDLVLSVADELKLSPSDRRDAEFVALLHDVGKIRIPSEIINKPGPLTPEERLIIETHTIEGEKMLDQVGGLIGHVGRLVRSCHEHYDGNGYPDRLAGEDIPLIARIVCACDAYSAMTTDRPYRAARTREAALAELVRCAGTQFDPRVVDAIVTAES